MNIFQEVDFKSHSGLDLSWKIECDGVSKKEWKCLTEMIMDYEKRPFQSAIGIPRGGVVLGSYLNQYSTENPDDPILIVDDVLTTGGSMEEFKRERMFRNPTKYIGWVVFARGFPPQWCRALFQMPFNPTEKL
tara:strand:- start:149 stop:547 length:399 start_codon:yes stop_codon:yes gene_type:complete